MEENENKERAEIFSRPVRAGKRTYFFDVKATVGDEYYITITESKRRFNNEQGTFFYEKHKIFLYKEDFDKFAAGLNEVIEFIRSGKAPIQPEFVAESTENDVPEAEKLTIKTIEFEDLSSESEAI